MEMAGAFYASIGSGGNVRFMSIHCTRKHKDEFVSIISKVKDCTVDLIW
jgi:hypothetical protein